MTTEPTYSQTEAALKAYYDNSHIGNNNERMKLALIAAQGVDPNVYGDMHYGWSVDGVMYQCNSVEAQRKLSDWHHTATHRVPSLERIVADERRRATDAEYMIEFLVPMLGPKAREVWQTMKDHGVVRAHASWAIDPMTMEGEAVAQVHLDIQNQMSANIIDVDADRVDVV